MLDWIRAGVEYKLKKEILNGLKNKTAELARQKKETESANEAVAKAIIDLEARRAQYKSDLAHAAGLPSVPTAALFSPGRMRRRNSSSRSWRSTR